MQSEPRERQVDVVLYLPHFGPGGSQKVAATLLAAWTERGLRCVLLTTRNVPPDAHRLAPGIERIVLFPKGSARSDGSGGAGAVSRPTMMQRLLALPPLRGVASVLAFARRIRTLRRYLAQVQPRVVLSFLTITNLTAILARRGLPVRLVISERNDPGRQPLARPMEALRRLTYRLADRVTANTHGAVAHMARYVPAGKLDFVANPLPTLPDRIADTAGARRFIFVGRLVPQKGVDDLLRAFRDCRCPGWTLDIVGDGPQREQLQREAESLGIAGTVRFLGHRSDVGELLGSASVFVLPSHYEGMPNALLEAMAYGLPLIVTDASPGPMELAADGVGLVVPARDSAALALALRQLAGDEALRLAMAAAARRKAATFALPEVLSVWGRILALEESAPTP